MKSMNKNIILISVIMIIAISVILFYQNKQKENDDKKMSVVFISKRLAKNHDFWSSLVEGIQMAATDYEIDIKIMGPDSETEIELQNEMILSAIEMKPDAIVLVPSDYTLTVPYAKKIEEADIKLVLLDSVMKEDLGLCAVATNNFEGGYKMGEYLKFYADENAVIGIVGHIPESSTAIEREKGVRAGLSEYENQIVDIVYCDSNREKARLLTLDLLEKYPEINMLVGLNEDSARGVAIALKEKELSKEVRLIGFDSSMEQVKLLEEGVFDAIVVQKPLNMGYLGLQKAYQAVKNEKLPESVDSGSVLITKDNLYTTENEKLIFPFREKN